MGVACLIFSFASSAVLSLSMTLLRLGIPAFNLPAGSTMCSCASKRLPRWRVQWILERQWLFIAGNVCHSQLVIISQSQPWLGSHCPTYCIGSIDVGSSLPHHSRLWRIGRERMVLGRKNWKLDCRIYVGFVLRFSLFRVSFGHRNTDRAGHLSSLNESANNEEESPIFLQFLDCVYQLLVQFPTQFEFNEEFLIAIIDGAWNWYLGDDRLLILRILLLPIRNIPVQFRARKRNLSSPTKNDKVLLRFYSNSAYL